MIYKTYGKTGVEVSAVGFGGMRFDTSLPMQKNAELLHYAAQKGITYFDTAPGYCADQSEKIFGIALKEMPRGSYYISTKRKPQEARNKQGFLDEVKKSLDRLNCGYIDFYHIWCLRNMSHYELAFTSGQYEALLEAKQQGLIKHIVCSSHQPGSEIRQIVEDGKVEGVLMGINILNFPYRWQGVTACHERGLGVVAMNPLGGGSIPEHEDKLRFLSKSGETPTEAALRFTIASPQITVTLNGFTTTEHIDAACRVADNALAYTNEEIEAIRKLLGDNMNAACTGCGYCMNCPQSINIAGYMQVYNEKQMFGASEMEMEAILADEHAWGRLVGVSATAADCIECGACEAECTQHLNIIERLAEMAAWER